MSQETICGIIRCLQVQHDASSEVAEVPEDSEDAKKWPLWKPFAAETTAQDQAEPVASGSTSIDQAAPSLHEVAVPDPTPSALETSLPSASPSKPPLKRPGPRKPKTTLAAIPSQKAKKLTTLDKSAMDWHAHVSSQKETGIQDELELNRRGGGYLEKVEFLQRVEHRREEALDASKSSSKRRRPG